MAPRREPSVYSIHAGLGVPLTAPLLPSVLGELAKHIQYSRGQCHAPVDRMIAGHAVRRGGGRGSALLDPSDWVGRGGTRASAHC